MPRSDSFPDLPAGKPYMLLTQDFTRSYDLLLPPLLEAGVRVLLYSGGRVDAEWWSEAAVSWQAGARLLSVCAHHLLCAAALQASWTSSATRTAAKTPWTI